MADDIKTSIEKSLKGVTAKVLAGADLAKLGEEDFKKSLRAALASAVATEVNAALGFGKGGPLGMMAVVAEENGNLKVEKKLLSFAYSFSVKDGKTKSEAFAKREADGKPRVKDVDGNYHALKLEELENVKFPNVGAALDSYITQLVTAAKADGAEAKKIADEVGVKKLAGVGVAVLEVLVGVAIAVPGALSLAGVLNMPIPAAGALIGFGLVVAAVTPLTLKAAEPALNKLNEKAFEKSDAIKATMTPLVTALQTAVIEHGRTGGLAF